MPKKLTKVISNLSSARTLASAKLGADDKCSKCGYIYPFILRSDNSREYLVGSYPYCKGSWRDHFTRKIEWQVRRKTYLYSPNAIKVRTVVWIGANGKISIPGHPDEKVPKGYEARELLSLAEVDNFTRELAVKEKEKYALQHEFESRTFDAYYRELRESMNHREVIEHRDDETGQMTRTVLPAWNEMSEFGKDLAREAEREHGAYKAYDPNYTPPVFFHAAHYDAARMRRMANGEE